MKTLNNTNRNISLALAITTALTLSLTACGNDKKTSAEQHGEHKAESKEMNHDMSSDKKMDHDMGDGKKMNHEMSAEMSDKMDDKSPVKSTQEFGNIVIKNAYVTSPMPGQQVAELLLSIENSSDKDIEITGITSDISKFTEFHTMEMKNSKMIMRKMDKVIIPATGKLVFNGHKHVMLIDPTKDFVAGEKVNFTMTLDNGEKISFNGEIQPPSLPGQ